MYILSDQVLSTEIDSDIIILDLNTGEYYGLNTISSDIWKSIENNTPIEDLINKVIADTGVEYNLIKEDFTQCIDQLIKLGLIYKSNE